MDRNSIEVAKTSTGSKDNHNLTKKQEESDIKEIMFHQYFIDNG